MDDRWGDAELSILSSFPISTSHSQDVVCCRGVIPASSRRGQPTTVKTP